MTGPGAGAARTAELAAALAAVRARIVRACDAAGRDVDGVTLVVVTKTRPASDVRALAGLGVREVGENRDQEARPKHDACADLDLVWHFVGRLQSNKARAVAGYADLVHSVDRPSVVEALSAGARRAGRVPGCLVQVSLDGDPARGGALPGDVPDLARRIIDAPSLELRGVMGVAPLGTDPSQAFRDLRRMADDVRGLCPEATMMSAGMSGDLEQAVRCGATHLRVGSAILGARPPLG